MQQHGNRNGRGFGGIGFGIGVVATGCLIATGAFRLANAPAAVATATPRVDRERTFTDRDGARLAAAALENAEAVVVTEDPRQALHTLAGPRWIGRGETQADVRRVRPEARSRRDHH